MSMKIDRVSIKNFKSLKEVNLCCGNLVSIIGENNSGKSNLIEALDLFFNPSVEAINEESFHEKTVSEPIEIRVDFKDLNAWESEYFSKWLKVDTLKVKRIIKWGEPPTITHVVILSVPEKEWLREDKVNGDRIDEWWANRVNLNVADHNFLEYLGDKKPNVGKWKEAIGRFLQDHGKDIHFIEEHKEDPTGFANVLKGGLPQFILVPAVRDVTEEIKVQKTNPFGRLIKTLLMKVPSEHRSKIEEALDSVKNLINRSPGKERIPAIKETEELLRKMLCPFVECDVEINVPIPEFERMFGNVEIFIDDGFRTSVETKGHGLQRSIIFSILRAYAELVRQGEPSAPKDRVILFAIEEPELYLHPQAQRIMMQTLREISAGKDQVVYSTHSVSFVDIAFFDEICLMRREKMAGHWVSTVTQLSMSDLIKDLDLRHPGTNATPESMRERYSHVYGVTRNEGFFARKVVLVEGPTEEYSLPIYSAALEYNIDKEGTSIIGTGGKGQMDRLLRVFNEFRIPFFIIFDADKNKANADGKRVNKELLELLGETAEETPTTKVKERFAVFEETFEAAVKGEIEGYDALASEARSYLGISGDGGKPLTARYIARKLVERGKSEGDATKFIPKNIKNIVERIRDLKWQGSVLKR
jgi:putative ATP-dependent endonuclease of OLD family